MTDVIDFETNTTEDITTGGGFDITPFIPLILLGIGGVVLLAATPTIINLTQTFTREAIAPFVRRAS